MKVILNTIIPDSGEGFDKIRPLLGAIRDINSGVVEVRNRIESNRKKHYFRLIGFMKFLTAVSLVPLVAFHIRSAYRGIEAHGLSACAIRSCAGLAIDGLLLGGIWSIARVGEAGLKENLYQIPPDLLNKVTNEIEQFLSRRAEHFPLEDQIVPIGKTADEEVMVMWGVYCHEIVREACVIMEMEELAEHVPAYRRLLEAFPAAPMMKSARSRSVKR